MPAKKPVAKKAAPKKDESKEVAVINAIESAAQVAKEIFISETGATPEALEKIKNTYSDVSFKDINDLAGYKFLVQGSKDLKTLRTTLSKKRKNLTAPALAFQKEMIATEDEVLSILKPIEDKVNSTKQDFEDQVQAAKNKLFKDRCALLDEFGYQLNGGLYICGAINIESDSIADLTLDEFDFYLVQGKKELDRVAAEEKRKAAEKAELEKEKKEMEAERKKFAAEKAAFEKEKAEMEAQKAALAETYKEIETVKETMAEKVVIQKAAQPGQSSLTKTDEELKEIGKVLKNADPSGTFFAPENKVIVEIPSMKETPVSTTTFNSPEELLNQGFDEMRNRVIALAKDKSQMISRAIIIEWAENEQL